MALFRGRGRRTDGAGEAQAEQRPVLGTSAFCKVCNRHRNMSSCWVRVTRMSKCPCCGIPFPNPEDLYKRFQPACPNCGEFLEQPGFQYGLCDGCGSKYELVEGTKPSLLPSRQQRKQMEKHGKSWSPQ